MPGMRFSWGRGPGRGCGAAGRAGWWAGALFPWSLLPQRMLASYLADCCGKRVGSPVQVQRLGCIMLALLKPAAMVVLQVEELQQVHQVGDVAGLGRRAGHGRGVG